MGSYFSLWWSWRHQYHSNSIRYSNFLTQHVQLISNTVQNRCNYFMNSPWITQKAIYDPLLLFRRRILETESEIYQLRKFHQRSYVQMYMCRGMALASTKAGRWWAHPWPRPVRPSTSQALSNLVLVLGTACTSSLTPDLQDSGFCFIVNGRKGLAPDNNYSETCRPSKCVTKAII